MEITANASQTVLAGSNVAFTDVVIPGGNSIIHRTGSGLVNLRGLTNGQPRARFRVYFNGNIAAGSSAAAISSAIAIDGEPVISATMISTPDATGEFNNISSSIFIDVPAGCCARVSVQNTSTQSILMQNANLIVERIA